MSKTGPRDTWEYLATCQRTSGRTGNSLAPRNSGLLLGGPCGPWYSFGRCWPAPLLASGADSTVAMEKCMGGAPEGPELALAQPGKTRSKKTVPFAGPAAIFFSLPTPPNPATRWTSKRIYFARLPQTLFSSFPLHPQISPQSFLVFVGKVPEHPPSCLPRRSPRFWACP